MNSLIEKIDVTSDNDQIFSKTNGYNEIKNQKYHRSI
jgi:hypothetical protein